MRLEIVCVQDPFWQIQSRIAIYCICDITDVCDIDYYIPHFYDIGDILKYYPTLRICTYVQVMLLLTDMITNPLVSVTTQYLVHTKGGH